MGVNLSTPKSGVGLGYGAEMRKITLIAVHCTATVAGKPFNVAAIRAMHKAQGWSDIGYHRLIGLNGEDWAGRPEAIAGAHIYGHNANSLAVCYVGGIGLDGKAADTRTDRQKLTLAQCLRIWRDRFPDARIRGHRDMSPDLNRDGKITSNEWIKMCPCFDVVEWCRSIGIDPK